MKENILNKPFKETDVKRLRNIIQGKSGDNSKTILGYTKKHEEHMEGEIWEEDGRIWTIKNGIKQNITKLDEAKKTINLPLFCPSCNKLMKPYLDKKWYNLFKRCFNCQIDFEHSIKAQGLWPEYEKFIFNSDIEGLMTDFELWINEEIENINQQSYISEAGDVENWVGNNKQKLLESKEETLKYLQSLKKV